MSRWRGGSWLDGGAPGEWAGPSGVGGFAPDRAGYDGADPAGGQRENLTIVTPDGGTRSLLVGYTDVERPNSGSAYQTRRVRDVATGTNFLLRRVVPGPRPKAAPDPYDLLDNEIQIGLHLIRALAGSGRYPRELARLQGYNDQADLPYLLLSERGRPVGQPPVRMRVEKKEQFQANLMRALALLAAAGVVHRNLNPMTVRWDDPHVQITDFRFATLVGEPRGPAPVGAWAAPEAHHHGVSAPPEDLWSAALLIVYLLTGRPPVGDGSPPDVSRMQINFDHIRGVFDRDPWARPDPSMIMERMRQPPPDLSGFQRIRDPAFDEGREAFEEMRADKADLFAATRDAGAGDQSAYGRTP
jgi:Protein kinase domain